MPDLEKQPTTIVVAEDLFHRWKEQEVSHSPDHDEVVDANASHISHKSKRE